MNRMNRRIFAVVSLLVLGALGIASYTAYSLGTRAGAQTAASAPESSAAAQGDKIDPKTGRRVLYWHDPMVPGQKFDKPGRSPFMNMQLVPVYADEAGDEGTVAISPRVVQSLGIRTAEVVKGALARNVQAVGNVAYNERELVLVQARVGGFVEKLHVRAPLDRVRKGQPLVEILSPDWIAAQEEYLALRKLQAPDAESLRDAARQRMRLVGMSEEAIRAFENTGKVQTHAVLYAPISGVVAELGAREGMTVMAGAANPGEPVEARAAAYPGGVWKGRIQALLPQVNQTTRTVTARIELATPRGRLVPGMFVTVDLASVAKPEALLVPSEAVIHTGTRSVVVTALGEGRFRPVEVESGVEVNGQTEIRKGLELGQKVVVSGQFLIASEANLKATGTRMEGAEASKAAAPQTHQAAGEIVSLGDGEVLIRHGDILTAGMGAMTMPFRAPGGVVPLGLKKGDRIRFEFSIGQDGQFQIKSLAPADASVPSHGAHK